MDWKYLRGSIMLKRQIAGVLFAGLVLVLGGCTTVKYITTVAELSQVSESHSIVFGRFEWFKNEEQAAFDPVLVYYPTSENSLRETIYTKRTSESGEFIWALKAGDYVFGRVFLRLSARYYVDPTAKFKVTENNRMYYIGTLRARATWARDSRGILYECVQFSIRDDSESDYTAFTDKFGVSSTGIEKALMVHRALPGKVEWTKCYEYDSYIPDVDWEIDVD